MLAGVVLSMPSGRGSSSSSYVFAEAIRAGTAPVAVVLGEADAIVALGAIVAAELYGIEVPVVVAPGAPLATGDLVTVRSADEGDASIVVDRGCPARRAPLDSPRDDPMPQLPGVERRRRALLRVVRHAPHPPVPRLRRRGAAPGPVLPVVRRTRRHRGVDRRPAPRGTPPGHDRVRRPRRVHRTQRPCRPRGRATHPRAVPRGREGRDRAVRRHARQVHRRRRDGRLRGADGPRGRPRAGRASRPRDPRPRDRRQPAGAHRGAHRRGPGHVRRRTHGGRARRRRRRQHRVAAAVVRTRGHRDRR